MGSALCAFFFALAPLSGQVAVCPSLSGFWVPRLGHLPSAELLKEASMLLLSILREDSGD